MGNSETNSQFEQLLRLARQGDESSLSELVQLYEPQIRAVARIRLGNPMRHLLDSADIVQSVHRSLLVGFRLNRFSFSTPAQLTALASTMVRRKVARQWRKLKNRQECRSEACESAPSKEDQAAEVDHQDQLELVYRQLSPLERQMVDLKLEGWRSVDIARRLEVDPDVLRVRFSRLRKRLRTLGVLEEWL